MLKSDIFITLFAIRGKGRIKKIDKSPNAIRAEKRGLFTKDTIELETLCHQGFIYSKAFFQWLCSKEYIRPKEYHHGKITTDEKRIKIIPYYDLDTITYVVEHFDLDFLYRIYSGELTYDDARCEKGISFCRVKAVSELVGIANKNPVVVDCIRQKNVIWFSKKKYMKLHEDKVKILEEWNVQPNSFSNINTRKIIRMLFSLKKRKIVRSVISL